MGEGAVRTMGKTKYKARMKKHELALHIWGCEDGIVRCDV